MPAGGSLSPAASQVAALIRKGQYAAAKSKAQAALLNSPGDESLRQMLGIAAYDSADFTTAAAAFDKVGIDRAAVSADRGRQLRDRGREDGAGQSDAVARLRAEGGRARSATPTRASRWAWRNWPTTRTPTRWPR